MCCARAAGGCVGSPGQRKAVMFAVSRGQAQTQSTVGINSSRRARERPRRSHPESRQSDRVALGAARRRRRTTVSAASGIPSGGRAAQVLVSSGRFAALMRNVFVTVTKPGLDTTTVMTDRGLNGLLSSVLSARVPAAVVVVLKDTLDGQRRWHD